MASEQGSTIRFGLNVQLLLALALALGLIAADYYGYLNLESLLGSRDIEAYFTNPHSGEERPADAIVAAIDRAEEVVWVASFDLDLESVIQALIRADERGLDVRVVVDADNEGLSAIRRLRRGGVSVRTDDREALMHDKFIVIDYDELWAGSLNLTENGITRNNNNMVRIFSEAVNENFAFEFEEMWEGDFGPRSPADTPHPRVRIEQAVVESYFSPEDEPRDALLSLLAGAEREIRFLAFSFTDDLIAAALLDAAADGVEVAGVVERFGASSTASQYAPLRTRGLDLRLDNNPGIMHHKVMIVDERWVVTGSYNFTRAAAESNDETLLIIEDPALAGAFLDEWWRVWEAGVP